MIERPRNSTIVLIALFLGVLALYVWVSPTPAPAGTVQSNFGTDPTTAPTTNYPTGTPSHTLKPSHSPTPSRTATPTRSTSPSPSQTQTPTPTTTAPATQGPSGTAPVPTSSAPTPFSVPASATASG